MKIPERTITRLSIYLRCLEELEVDGVTTISSMQLAERFGLNSAQVRKDLAYFGQFGVRGLGYYVVDLKHNLEKILGLKQIWEVALVGMGNLGTALFHYRGFKEKGFRITALFDRDPTKIGQRMEGVEVHSVEDIVPVLRRRKIKIAVIAIPAAGAQAVAEQLVKAGVNAILNFSPTQISVPPRVKIQNVDMAVLLKTLTYHSVRTDRRFRREESQQSFQEQ